LTGVKRRRSNAQHLKPMEANLKIERGASDEDIIEALKADGKIGEMKAEVKLEV
jgi:ribosomal protein L14E/L6E/L27E